MAKQQLDILQALGITQWQLRTPHAMPVVAKGDSSRDLATDLDATPSSEPVTLRAENVVLPTHMAHPLTPSAEVNSAVASASKLSSATQEAPPLPDTTHTPNTTHEVGAKNWAGLDMVFAQRRHCGDHAKLNALPDAEQRVAECAVVLPAPSAHDVAQQRLLSEPAQNLLSDILRAVALGDSRIYQTSVLKCAGADISEEPCSGWVQSELELLSPKFCLVFGESAARTVLKTNRTLDDLRQAPQEHPFLPIHCFVTHALEDLLARPELKRECWHDLKPVVQFLADRSSPE